MTLITLIQMTLLEHHLLKRDNSFLTHFFLLC